MSSDVFQEFVDNAPSVCPVSNVLACVSVFAERSFKGGSVAEAPGGLRRALREGLGVWGIEDSNTYFDIGVQQTEDLFTY